MSNRFLKLIICEESMYLLKEKGHAFRLLTIIAESARRYDGHPDGLNKGEALIGGHKDYDMSEQNYRSAKKILERRQHIKITETCRNRKKVTTGVTTVGTRVKLLSSNVYNISLEEGNDRSNDRVTTDQRPTNDELRMIDIKNIDDDNAQSPKLIQINDLMDEFHSKSDLLNEKKDLSDNSLNITYNISEKPFLELSQGIFISQTDLDKCVKIKGSLEAAKAAIEYIWHSPARKKNIKNWPNALEKWETNSPKRPKDALTFNFEIWQFEGINDKDFFEWGKIYPHISFDQEISKAAQWLKSNPSRSSKRLWRKFLTSWLDKANQAAEYKKAGQAAKGSNGVDRRTKDINGNPVESPHTGRF